MAHLPHGVRALYQTGPADVMGLSTPLASGPTGRIPYYLSPNTTMGLDAPITLTVYDPEGV